jgi:hypothetical protein
LPEHIGMSVRPTCGGIPDQDDCPGRAATNDAKGMIMAALEVEAPQKSGDALASCWPPRGAAG